MTLPLETARFEALKKLASERFGEVTPAEEQVLELSASTEDVAPPEAEERPEVRAAFLRWLATDRDVAAHIDPLGLRVDNATIPSALDLDFCRMPFRLRFRRCTLQGKLHLRSVEVPALYAFHCKIEDGISADGLRVQGNVFLRYLQAKGELRFLGAQIGRDLDCSGASLTAEDDTLSADKANITGSVFFRDQFSCSGTIRLLGAQIGGDLDCSGATLTAEGDALSAGKANISGNVFLKEKFSSSGAVRFPSAQIGGSLECNDARVRVLNCENLRLEGDLIWTAVRDPNFTYLNLLGASVKTLRDDTASWPARGNLAVRGLEYSDLAHHEPSTEEHLSGSFLAPQRKLDAGERIRWLSLQDDEDRLDPQAWMWLAKLFKEKDDIAGYRRIVCAYRCMNAKTYNSSFLRWFETRLARLEENPLRILWAFVPLLVLGSLLFWCAAKTKMMPPTNQEVYSAWATGKTFPIAYPQFNPVVYTLDNELPVVKFGMDDKWAPDPNLVTQGKFWIYWFLTSFRWFLILAGWAQGILLTIGISRRFRD